MAKAFFEKLTLAGQKVSTRQSVISNVSNILNFGGFLDAGVDGFPTATSSTFDRSLQGIYQNGLLPIVDQGLDNQQQIKQFQRNIAKVISLYEPRIKNVWVINAGTVMQRSRCQLKIELMSGIIEQEFTFG